VDLGTEESNAEIAPPAGVEIDGKWVRPNDGHSMVYVPAGSFSMGGAGVFEQPVHEVNLDGYWIDEAEITNAQFAVFVSDTSYKTSAEQSGESRVIYSEENWDYEDGADWRHPLGPGSSLDGKKDHPVVHVSWEDAESYCTWAGARLPTEAEWEYAARGPNALKFPWGNSFDTTKLNFCDVNCPDDYYRDETANDGYAFTSPVGTYPQGASWVGALDMAGNVSEWINDWFDEEYYAISPIHNPQGPNSGEVKVFRDGGWDMDYLYLESHLRSFAGEEDSRNVLGFRCAIDATATDSGLTANQVIEVPTEIPVKEEVRSLGVEREDFFDVFKRLGFKFEEINDIDGQPRMMGTSPDGLAFVELYGPANELIKATLVVGISQVNPFEVEVSSAFVREFLDITVPEWDKGIDWVIENEEFASRNSEVSTTYGDRLIRLSIVPDLGILTLVVEAAGENP
jgi:formylglycine-generating enzyme required for sulfatase activity